ncbi:carbon-nitrogen hydrolase [Pleurotus eryngii]|uniref:Carbon-nitrogen hydrolase n=1 Tax=Pleurotus eryngii TaxID=5323 RepID=A0A9P6D671_PLEER|nr:carbon-nitrogen hydrolase [Pleurotus eryngii]
MPITLNPSNSDTRVFKVAAVQAEPVWLDLKGSVDKTIAIIQEASAAGAKIIGFPEVFIPGYPWTIWANDFTTCQPILKEYQANALAVHSPEMESICLAAKNASATVVLGFAERDGGSLYISQVTITDDGKIANHRQKIKLQATGYEKVVFGDGKAQTIHNVVQTDLGRVGSLSCWEHIQPFLKCHFYAQHPQIFVGSWPPVFLHQGQGPYSISSDACRSMSQVVAIEGGCYGIISTQVMSQAGAEKMKVADFPWLSVPGGGFACIYGPDGRTLTKPLESSAEGILYADISLDKIGETKMIADMTGNYSRPDLFRIVVNGSNKDIVEYRDDEESKAAAAHNRAIDNAGSSKTF